MDIKADEISKIISVHPHTTGFHTQMSASGQAVSAVSTNNMPLAAHHVTFTKIVDVGANLFYDSSELMA